jgi:hypothetical protein
MKHYRTASIAALMLGLATLPALSHAQYMWLDEKGLKQLSDQPPPLSVPQNRILKQPRGQGVLPDAVPAAAAEGAPEAPEAKVKRPPTLADRNADFAKRKAESSIRAAASPNTTRTASAVSSTTSSAPSAASATRRSSRTARAELRAAVHSNDIATKNLYNTG